MNEATIHEIAELKAKLEAMRSKCAREKRKPNSAEISEAAEILKQIQALESNETAMEWAQSLPLSPPIRPELPYGSMTGGIESKGKFSGGDKCGFRNIGEYFSTLVKDKSDSRIKRLEVKALEVGSFSEGGSLVPESFSNELINLIVEKSVILPGADTYPMAGAGDVLKIPAVDDTDHSADRAGLVASWTAEGGTINPDEIKTRQLELRPKKLTLLVKASREFLQDAVQAERFVTGTMKAEAAWQVDHALINGTGAGMPLGIMKGPDLLTVAIEPGQEAASFLWENATSLYQAADPSGDANLIWLFSPSLKRQLFTMGVVIGLGGVGYWPALREASGSIVLLAKPAYFSEHCAIAGAVGDALLVNPQALAVAIKQQVQIDMSQHVYFTTDYVAFKLTMRIDAQSKYSAPLTLNDGSTQVSNFVTLAARS